MSAEESVARPDLAYLTANALAQRQSAPEPKEALEMADTAPDCQCRDCESAVSPLAYLAELMDYALLHLKNGGAPVDLAFLAANFHQPFGALPTACDEMDRQVRQVRICIEVLRSYLKDRTTPPELSAGEARYLFKAYATLLLRLGTSYEEIRLVRTAPSSVRKAVADRLLIDQAHLDSLFLDPDALPAALTEQVLEERFGLADTTVDPLAVRPVPLLQTWRGEHLRAQWRSQDWPADLPDGPFIDPDLIGPDDFRHPVAKADAGAADRAFDVWLRRRAWVDGRLGELAAVTREAHGQRVPDLNAMLAAQYRPLSYGSASLIPWGGAPGPEALAELQAKLTRGQEMTAGVAVVEQQLHLSVESFLRLMELRAKDALALADIRSPRLTDLEWEEVRSILVQAQKAALSPVWSGEEQAIPFGPGEFWLSLREPVEGEWPVVRAEDVPLIDPDLLKPQELPEGEVGRRAASFWQARRDALAQIRAALAAERESEGFDAMLRLALGLPHPGGPLEHDLDQLLQDLASVDDGVVQAARSRIERDLRLTVDSFRKLMTVRAKDAQPDPHKKPTAEEYDGVYTTLTAARKHKHEYPAWAAEEGAPTGGLLYWEALKARLPRWRASAERRREWQEALRLRMQPPIIDPDLIGRDDLKEPVGENPAFPIWQARRQWVDQQIAALRSTREGRAEGGYDQILRNSTGLSLADLSALAARQEAGESIAGRLAQVSLTPDSFVCLLRVVNLEQAGGPVLASEWEEVYNILAMCLKRRQSAQWREEEKGAISLSPDLFRLPPAGQPAAAPLPSWRASWSDRQEWLDRLQARIEQEEAAVRSLGEAVGAVEEAALPLLRDALVEAAEPGSDSLAVKAKRLTDRLLIDAQASGCQVTSRIAQAIETLQGLLWSVRSHQLEDSHPNLTLAAPHFDREWEWLGSYSTWRSATFVFTYPENILLPSLRPRQSPAFRTLLAALRSNRRLTPEQACREAERYADYFRDVCSLELGVCCTARTHIPGSSCIDRSVEGYKDLAYYFAISRSSRVYWSTDDPADPSGNGQSFWQSLDEVENALSIVGATVYTPWKEPFLYLFVRTQKEESQKLLFLRYSLEHRRWDSPVELDLPEGATQFTARLRLTDANTPPTVGIWLPNGAGYSRGLNRKGDGWGGADFTRIFVTGGWRHLSPEPGHPLEADLDGFGGPIPARFAVAGDFDGDGRQELAVAPDIRYTESNDFWVYKYQPATKTWDHLSRLEGHPYDADLDCSEKPNRPRFALAGDVNGDGRDELIVAIESEGSGSNDFWVMNFDPATGTWSHIWRDFAGHPLEADLDGSEEPVGVKFAVVGDFNGDGRAEIAMAMDLPGTEGNDFWVYGFDPATGDWYGVGVPGGPYGAHLDVTEKGDTARWGVAGDLNGDGRDELILAIDASGTGANDFWVMGYDPGTNGWYHLYPDYAGHPGHADLDCSEDTRGARFAITGDFNGDGRDEIAIAATGFSSEGNDFWVYGFDPSSTSWYGLGQGGGSFGAHLDASGSGYPARFALAADFDGDGKDEIAICPFAPGTLGNDFWVFFFDPPSGTWQHLSRLAWHHLESDFDCSSVDFPAKWGVTGDFDGDGQAEIAAAIGAPETGGNDFWVMRFDTVPVEYQPPCRVPIGAVAPQFAGPFTVPARLADWELDQRKEQIRAAFLQNQGGSRTSRIYLEEFWYFVPLQIALQLQQRGHYTEALDWYRTIYDYSRQKKIYYDLEREESIGGGYERPADWLLDPLNPHGVALTRAHTYTRFTLLSIARCFLEYADAEFTRDTAESLPRARTLYVTAQELLDLPVLQANCTPAPALSGGGTGTLAALLSEKRALLAECQSQLLTMVDPAALVSGSPAEPALAGIWLPSLAYTFCIPPNPIPSWLRLRAAVNLDKLRNCRNIAGMERYVDPYAAPTDTTSGMPVIGADGQLILPGARAFQPTPYRFPILIERAKQFVQLASQVESAMLAALEKQDFESYTLLKARQDVDMARAGVRLQDLRVREAEGGVKLAELQQQRAQLQVDHYQGLLDEGELASETAALALMITAAGFHTLSAAAYAYTTFADFDMEKAARALSESGSAASSWAQYFSTYASYQRRVQEWQFSRSLSAQDVEIGRQQVRLAQEHVKVVGQERQMAELQVDHARATVEFLANKFTNAELYHWMAGILQGVYSYFLQQATAVARLAGAQLAFERQETPPPFIRSDYWEAPDETVLPGDRGPDRRGLTGSARLLQDIYQLDQYAFETNKRKLQLSRTISLARLDPFAFQRFRETGVMRFATPMELFDRDFPGHYLRLIRGVRTSVIALVPPTQGIRATLSNTGASRTVIGGDLFQRVVVRREPESVALSGAANATGLLEMDPQAEMLLPFEGLGVDTAWSLELPRAANPFDFRTIADVLLTVEYTALSSPTYRAQLLQTMPASASAQRSYSFRYQFADQWYDLNNPAQSSTPMTVRFTTRRGDFMPNLEQLRTTNIVLYFVRKDGRSFEVAVRHLLYREAGTVGTVGGAAQSVDGLIRAVGGTGGSWLPIIGRSPAGDWELALADTPEMRERFRRGEIEDVLLVITYAGRAPSYP